MDLYIGNATSQNWDFHYRIPENKSLLHEMIPMGSQIKISGDLSPTDIDAIISQNKKYGLVSVQEIDQSGSMFRGLCYSVGKEIASTKIERLFRQNTNVLVLAGQQYRKDAAIVENHRLLRQNQEMDLPAIRETEISMQEEVKERQKGMAEGYRTEFDTPSPRKSRRARKG